MGMSRSIALVLLAVSLGSALSAPAQGRRGRRRRDNPNMKVGKVAPDFELPRLDLFLKAIETKQPMPKTVEKVKLSSFKGKRPVLLMFGSYT